MIYPPNDWRRTHQLRACLAGPAKREIEDMVRVGANVIQVNLNGPVTDRVEMKGILGGDPVGDFVAFTHSLGAKAVGYLNTRLSSTLKATPDWVAVTDEGGPMGGEQQPSACEVGPYGQYLIDRMALYTREHPLDGWWLDCWTFGLQNCWCKYCREAFTKATGCEMPAKADPVDMRWRKYAEWRDEAAREFFGRMHRTVKMIRPDCHIWVNFSPGPSNAPLPHSDMVFRMVEGPTVEQWLTGHQDNSLTAPFSIARMRGAAGYDRESEIWIVCNPLQWDRTTTPDVEFMARTYTTIAHGLVAQYPTGPGHDKQMKPAFDAIRAREKWLVDTEPVKYAALLLSWRTPEYYGRDQAIKKYYNEIMGVYRALIEEHVPVNIVTPEDVEAGGLKGYAVAILPNAACPQEGVATRVREYVAAGGAIVATHDTGRYDGYGELRSRPAFEDLFGARIVGEENHQPWVPDRLWLEDHFTTDDEIIRYSKWGQTTSTPEGWVGSVDWVGRALNVEVAHGAATARGGEGAVEVVARRNELGSRTPTWPALVLSRCGKGRVAWFPMEIGTSYYDTSYPYLRRWLRRTIEWAAGDSSGIEVEAPMCVLSTFWTQDDWKRLIVHLLNDNSSSGRRARDAAYGAQREEVLPVHDIRIRVSPETMKVKRATLQPENLALAVRAGRDFQEVTVPRLLQHSMVVME